jgi:hypothetical protein
MSGEKGDIDTFIAPFADNAVFTPSLQAFRVDGKAALKTYFTALFETDPTRHIAGRQGSECERHCRCGERVLRPHIDR